MEKKKINKKILILLLFVAITLIFSFFIQLLPNVIFLTDNQYYENVIEKQKFNLSVESLKKGKHLKIKKIEYLDDSIMSYIYDNNATLIFSPLVSYKIMNDGIFSEIENPYITIGVDTNKENSRVAIVDKEYKGWGKLASQLKRSNQPVYLISDSSWPQSLERAKYFRDEFGESGLTYIEANGEELKQYSLQLIDKIKKEGIHEVVFTGSSLFSYFSSEDDTLSYSLPSSLSTSIDYNQINKVVYDDLSLIIKSLDTNDRTIILSQDVWDFQEGLKNFLLQRLKSLESKIY